MAPRIQPLSPVEHSKELNRAWKHACAFARDHKQLAYAGYKTVEEYLLSTDEALEKRLQAWEKANPAKGTMY